MNPPLHHRRIVVTRPAAQASALMQSIRELGGEPLLLPLLVIEPLPDPHQLRQAAETLSTARFAIFVSPNAVEQALPLLLAHGSWPEGVQAVAIGPGTAHALQQAHITDVLCPRQQYDSQGVLALPELQTVDGQRILIFRGEDGKAELGDGLQARGAQVAYIPCYRRLLPKDTAQHLADLLSSDPPDAFIVTSSEAARHLFSSAGESLLKQLQSIPIGVTHPQIGDTVRAHGGSAVEAGSGGDLALLKALSAALDVPPPPVTTGRTVMPEPTPASPVQPQRPGLGERLVERINPTLLVALVALGILIWQWRDNSLQLSQLRSEVGLRLAETGAFQKQSRDLIERIERARIEERSRLVTLETRMAESQSQQATLAALYQNLNQHRDSLLLAEVEQLLMAASQQLQIANDPRAALVALEGAQSRLALEDNPKFLPLRQSVGKDIATLKTLPNVDTVNLTMRLDAMLAVVDNLPFSIDSRPQQAPKLPNVKEEPDSLSKEIWGEIKQLIRIRRIDKPDAPLLPAEQTYFVRENMKLRLLSARTALQQHDENVFRTDLQAVRQSLQGFFDTQSMDVKQSLTQLNQMLATPLQVKLPDLTASLSALGSLKTLQEQELTAGAHP